MCSSCGGSLYIDPDQTKVCAKFKDNTAGYVQLTGQITNKDYGWVNTKHKVCVDRRDVGDELIKVENCSCQT